MSTLSLEKKPLPLRTIFILNAVKILISFGFYSFFTVFPWAGLTPM